MTRNELARKVAEDSESTYVASDQWTKTVLASLADAIAKEGEVSIQNLGKFEHYVRPAKVGRNYKTGERVEIPAKMKVRFIPCAKIAETVAQESTDKD